MPLAIAVYAAGYVSFVRARRAGETYDALLGALGRLAEMNEAVAAGHAERSAQLAIDVGTRLGVGSHELAAIGAASRVRSVGTVGWEPPPRVRPGFDHATVARWSQAIVGRRGPLSEIAMLVGSDDGSVLAAIVEMATTYDEAIHTMGMAPGAALALVGRDADQEGAVVTAAPTSVLVDRGVL